MDEFDVLVIGSEGAGARSAIAAAETGARVGLVTKGRLGQSGATLTASADINVDGRSIADELCLEGDRNDSPEAFLEDILNSGRYLNNKRLAEIHVQNAPVRVKEMINWGMKVRGIIHCPGHRHPRGIFTTGREMVGALRKKLSGSNVSVKEDTMVLDLLTARGKVVGVFGLDLRSGQFVAMKAKAVILATGGGMMLYPYRTAPEELTGDGYAIAMRAGARLVDMEMVQFMPCSLIQPPSLKGNHFPFNIAAESSNSLEGWLLNRQGQRFMYKWDPKRMEHSTRDKLSLGIASEIRAGRGTPGGGVYLSFAHLPGELLEYFPKWALKPQLKENWKYEGLDFSVIGEKLEKGEAIEVGIASHFFVGGVQIDHECRTSLEGLYAAGEVAGGLHGANRLSGNACLEVLVEGEIAGRNAANFARNCDLVLPERDQLDLMKEKFLLPLLNREGDSPFVNRDEIESLAWDSVGVIRCSKDLDKSLQKIDLLKGRQKNVCCGSKDRIYNREWIEALQNSNRLEVLESIIRSALARKESRGVHFREDWPKERDEFQFNLVSEQANNKVIVFRDQITGKEAGILNE